MSKGPTSKTCESTSMWTDIVKERLTEARQSLCMGNVWRDPEDEMILP